MPTSSALMRGAERALSFIDHMGVLRTRDLTAAGIPRTALPRLVHSGRLERIGRGLYVPSGAPATAQQTVIAACARVPAGVVCLLSALRFHELTMQDPFQVWLALDRKRARPHVPELPLRIVRFSGRALHDGIEQHRVASVLVRVYTPAKTVADCFKYRNKIGLDVALEALRDCWRQRRASMDELWHQAEICRVANVMRPYLESLV